MEQFIRTELIFGREAMDKLAAARVAVFGIGGVGGYTVEALVRSGVGAIDIIDNDVVCLSNINRQIYALTSTVGQYKTDAAAERIMQINPHIRLQTHKVFYSPETSHMFDFSQYDHIVDAIDSVTGKIELAVQADRSGTPLISSMGAGNKTDPTAFEVADIYKTSVCPLARVMRHELKKRGIKGLKVVYSKEQPVTPFSNPAADEELKGTSRRQTPGSNAFVPPVAGLIIAGEVIKDIIGYSQSEK